MAEHEAGRLRAEVTGPLAEQAEADGAAYLAAFETEMAANTRLATIGRFGRRKARAAQHAATEHTRTIRAQARDTWGVEPPRTSEALPAWATTAAARQANSDPRVRDADRAVETANADHEAMQRRHRHERLALLASELGAEHARRDQLGMHAIHPHRNARDAQTTAARAQAEANELRSLPINEAARLIEAKHAEQEQMWQQAAQRGRQLHDPSERDPHRTDPGHDSPARGL